jgi:hypothetical protein
MNYYNLLLNFLTKYLFILNAASDGWRVCYIGADKFEFHNKLQSSYITNKLNNINNNNTNNIFIEKYTKKYLQDTRLYNNIQNYIKITKTQ